MIFIAFSEKKFFKQFLRNKIDPMPLKYKYEFNCQEKCKSFKFIAKRRITSLMHSSILQQIWLYFMANTKFLVSFGSFTIFTIFWGVIPTFSA
jgi:hypothetical protein